MPIDPTVIAFDLYGTLLSTDSIVAELAGLFGEDEAPAIATLWRRYQLEYTWRLNSMGTYASFRDVSRAALLHAAAESVGASPSSTDADRLMAAYDGLHAFPDVPQALQSLVAARDSSSSPSPSPSIEPYVFSNGTPDMLHASVSTSPDLAPFADLFADRGRLVSVHELCIFKPHPDAYAHLLRCVGRTDKPGDVWLVSANPFDAVGAAATGLKAAWIDRAGTGWIDRLGGLVGEGVAPTIVVSDVGAAVAEIMKKAEERG